MRLDRWAGDVPKLIRHLAQFIRSEMVHSPWICEAEVTPIAATVEKRFLCNSKITTDQLQRIIEFAKVPTSGS